MLGTCFLCYFFWKKTKIALILVLHFLSFFYLERGFFSPKDVMTNKLKICTSRTDSNNSTKRCRTMPEHPVLDALLRKLEQQLFVLPRRGDEVDLQCHRDGQEGEPCSMRFYLAQCAARVPVGLPVGGSSLLSRANLVLKMSEPWVFAKKLLLLKKFNRLSTWNAKQKLLEV